MPIETGQTLLHYRLIEKIGEGGMGVVWRARDSTLGRDVAIKVLPAGFAGEPERMARFEREARLLAALNHSGIAAIYGLHEADGVRFLALELVEGEDLSQRLTLGPIPVDEALSLALRIAEALEYAHEHGIVHRDLTAAPRHGMSSSSGWSPPETGGLLSSRSRGFSTTGWRPTVGMSS